jgi:phosphonate transport system substrate-binding protein
LLTAALLNVTAAIAGSDTKQFRIGFSARTFTDVNDNDALAAIKVWSTTIAREQGIPMSPSPLVLKGVNEIRLALSNQEVDALALPIDEYWPLRDLLDNRVFIGNEYDGKITEEYLLLVHKDSGLQRLDDLRGQSLIFMQNSLTSLATIWLDTELIQAGFPQAAGFCKVTYFPNLSKSLLPVFFRQADACVVTRNGFKTMGELNPQIIQQLKVLATSPELVSSGFTFRRDYDEPVRATIIKELTQMMTSPAGAQVMKLFKSGSLVSRPASCLDSSFELLATYERLLGKNQN